MTDDFEGLQDWVGRTQHFDSLITAYPADALAATFDRDDAPLTEGDAIPPGWHQLYLREVVKLSETGRDGHPATGDFLPPVPLPRRMWAGTKSVFHAQLRVGEPIRKLTTIEAVTPKQGKTGRLVFVTLRHEISGATKLAATEIQDVVYREEAKPGAPPPVPRPAPAEAVWRRPVHPTPVLLFRFSALTMNSHRIHYDRSYVTEVEGYPGLLVHGPLTAVLLMDLFRREMPDAVLTTFDVRAVAPLYDTGDFSLEGAPDGEGKAKLWALDHTGALAMSVEATFAG